MSTFIVFFVVVAVDLTVKLV